MSAHEQHLEAGVRYTLPKVKENEVYYHALSHHVAHWAAYSAMIVGLVTFGFAISTASKVESSQLRWVGATSAVTAGWACALYFINGMAT